MPTACFSCRPPSSPGPRSPPAGRPAPPALLLCLPRAAALGALLFAALGCGARQAAAPLAPGVAALPRVPTAPVPAGCTVLLHVPAGDEVRLPEGSFGLWGAVLPAVAGARCLLHGGAAGDGRGPPLRWSFELPAADLGPLRCVAAGASSPPGRRARRGPARRRDALRRPRPARAAAPRVHPDALPLGRGALTAHPAAVDPRRGAR